MNKLAAFRAEWDATNETLMRGFENLHNEILNIAQLQILNNSNHIGVIQSKYNLYTSFSFTLFTI